MKNMRDYYTGDIVWPKNYYPFGQLMEGRYGGTSDYRYGMNGQEHENEITNSQSHYSAEYWMYDARLGRRWERDPILIPYESPYSTFSNNPIIFIDPFGLSPHDWKVNDDGTKTKIGDTGGDEYQIYHYGATQHENGAWQSKTQVIVDGKAEDHFLGPTYQRETGSVVTGVSTVDLWSDVPYEYQGAYDSERLMRRYRYLKECSENGACLKMERIYESEGALMNPDDMIWDSFDYHDHLVNKYGSDASFFMAVDLGMLPMPVPTSFEELLPGAIELVRSAPRNYGLVIGHQFNYTKVGDLPQAHQSQAKLNPNAKYSNTKEIRNSWIKFLMDTKGQYKGKYGKEWIQKAREDYYKSDYYKP